MNIEYHCVLTTSRGVFMRRVLLIFALLLNISCSKASENIPTNVDESWIVCSLEPNNRLDRGHLVVYLNRKSSKVVVFNSYTNEVGHYIDQSSGNRFMLKEFARFGENSILAGHILSYGENQLFRLDTRTNELTYKGVQGRICKPGRPQTLIAAGIVYEVEGGRKHEPINDPDAWARRESELEGPYASGPMFTNDGEIIVQEESTELPRFDAQGRSIP